MKLSRILSASLAVVALSAFAPSMVFAGSGASGPVTHKGMGKIGGLVMNPYDVAPLTAIINNGGYTLSDISVVVKGKEGGGVDIKYNVSNQSAMLHGGIPIWGMYPDLVNKIEVKYKRNGEAIAESYDVYAPPVLTYGSGVGQKRVLPKAVVTKTNPQFKDNLYLMNHLSAMLPNASNMVWNLPAGGALEWDYESYVWVVDSVGDIRWYLKTDNFRDPRDLRKKGNMMGFYQTKDGSLMWGMSQTYKKYDLMGRKVFDRDLPRSYVDFSHHLEETAKGTYLLRVASGDYKRKDGKNVRSVRDVIVELDNDGKVVDEWKVMEILDPYRDVNLLAMDQGAVCLNIDAAKSGTTATKEELESSNQFGDGTGVGAGRNWAHINSVNYDATDDSIILSVRNQSAVVKVGRDKKVKWIIASPEGWSDAFKKYVLKPVDNKGNALKCTGSKCEGTDFDWSWVQHTAYKVNEKSKPNMVHVSVFDNGDSRGMEQPAIPSQKYSRAVEYVVDEKNMTVRQAWEYGKERGFEWYSPITSVTEYQAKTDTMFVYSATAGMGDLKAFFGKNATGGLVPFLEEIKYGTQEVLFEMKMVEGNNAYGYRALPISLEKSFK